MYNLKDVRDQFLAEGVPWSLFGTTSLHASKSGFLGPDHDDDVCIPRQHRTQAIASLGRLGFELIRYNDTQFSMLRYGRYIDFHVLARMPETSHVRVHGEELIRALGPVQKSSNENVWRVRKSRARSLTKKAKLQRDTGASWRHIVAAGASTIDRRLRASLRESRGRYRRVRWLTEDDFLRLKIDIPYAVNWVWRRSHYLPVFEQGETMRRTLERLERKGVSYLESVAEVDTSAPFEEPINLNRKFWHEGANMFAYPVLFGLRHLVVPYAAANLYIGTGLLPRLYSARYYAGLTSMNRSEIQGLFSNFPIEITDGAVTSGRHRVAAVLGHLLAGGEYTPIAYERRV